MTAREIDSEVYAEMVIEHSVPKGMKKGSQQMYYLIYITKKSHLDEQKAEDRCLNGKSWYLIQFLCLV